MKKNKRILGILFSAFIYFEASLTDDDFNPTTCVFWKGWYFYSENNSTKCRGPWFIEDAGCWEICDKVYQVCNFTKNECLEMAEKYREYFKPDPICVMDKVEQSYVYRGPYPSRLHWICDEVEPGRYENRSSVIEAEENHWVSLCPTYFHKRQCPCEPLIKATPESESTSSSTAETYPKYNADSTSPSAAETDLKSRGDKNPRPAIVGTIAAFVMCVLLQQI